MATPGAPALKLGNVSSDAYTFVYNQSDTLVAVLCIYVCVHLNENEVILFLYLECNF